MAATLTMSNEAKALFINALKEDLTHVYLGRNVAQPSIDQTLTTQDIVDTSSDMSSRVRQVRLTTSTQEYATTNNIQLADETRITNFYLLETVAVNKLILMNNTNQVRAIITIPLIVPDAIKTLYVPQIKINIL